MTSSFGDDEFGKMAGVEALGAPGLKSTWGVGLIFGQCLTLLSCCPAAVLWCGVEKNWDDADSDAILAKEIVAARGEGKSMQYGAHASSAVAVGSALTGTAGYGMAQSAPGMYTVEVVQEQYVDTHVIPGGFG